MMQNDQYDEKAREIVNELASGELGCNFDFCEIRTEAGQCPCQDKIAADLREAAGPPKPDFDPEFHMACDGCLTWMHKDSPGGEKMPDDLIYCERCAGIWWSGHEAGKTAGPPASVPSDERLRELVAFIHDEERDPETMFDCLQEARDQAYAAGIVKARENE